MRRFALIRARARAAWWVVRATTVARRQIRSGGVDALDVPAAPPTSAEAKTWARLLMRVVSRNCLVRAAVRQAWYAGQGRPVDLVIGVTAPADGFRAHAWLDIDPPHMFEGYEELARRQAQRPV